MVDYYSVLVSRGDRARRRRRQWRRGIYDRAAAMLASRLRACVRRRRSAISRWNKRRWKPRSNASKRIWHGPTKARSRRLDGLY